MNRIVFLSFVFFFCGFLDGSHFSGGKKNDLIFIGNLAKPCPMHISYILTFHSTLCPSVPTVSGSCGDRFNK